MSKGLKLTAFWETLDEGSPEERAAFGCLEMKADDIFVTEGQDTFVNRLRVGPFVSNYHCAEWLAWNWWRLRWEPRANGHEWAMAHKMASIGHGYIWPNVTFYSDSERVVLVAKPSSEKSSTSFRYIKDICAVTRAVEFESAIDSYVDQVISQLRAEGVGWTNLDQIWTELRLERRDSTLSMRRRLEALMGFDPGEAGETILDALLEDGREVGEDATQEMAAHSAVKEYRRATDLQSAAVGMGFAANLNDAVSLPSSADLPAIGFAPAWKRGAAAAAAVRCREGLKPGPIADRELEKMAGIASGAIKDRKRRDADLSFLLGHADDARIVLRSRWKTGRRFELARLIGDRVAHPSADALRPATGASTYRQQMQRSFAAEFLCPLEALIDELKGDYSAEAIDDAAHLFQVSERTVRTLLVNHDILERDLIDGDIGDIMAA